MVPSRWAIILNHARSLADARKRRWHSFKEALSRAGSSDRRARLCSRSCRAERRSSQPDHRRGLYLDQWLEHIKTQGRPATRRHYGEIGSHLPQSRRSDDVVDQATAHDDRPTSLLVNCFNGRWRAAGGLSPQFRVPFASELLSSFSWLYALTGSSYHNPCDDVGPPCRTCHHQSVGRCHDVRTFLERAQALQIFMQRRDAPGRNARTSARRVCRIAVLRRRSGQGQAAVTESFERHARGEAQEPKSGRGRKVGAPGQGRRRCRAWRARQAEELLRLGDDTFICASEDGQPVQPQSLACAVACFAREPAIPAHVSRSATRSRDALLGSGVAEVLQTLGHATVGLTLDPDAAVQGTGGCRCPRDAAFACAVATRRWVAKW